MQDDSDVETITRSDVFDDESTLRDSESEYDLDGNAIVSKKKKKAQSRRCE